MTTPTAAAPALCRPDLALTAGPEASPLGAWYGDGAEIAYDEPSVHARLSRLDRALHAVRRGGRVGIAGEGVVDRHGAAGPAAGEVLAALPAFPAERLGDPGFRADHRVSLAYAAGAMANGIACEAFVIALGRAGLLGTFGAAGLAPRRIEAAIGAIQEVLPAGPYAFNLIHSPGEEALERATVELYLARGVRTVEASAFLRLTPHVVRYRVAGLGEAPDGTVVARNRVIAKVSRREIATHFLSPAPSDLLRDLVQAGWIEERQARLAERVPLADDLTVEADSGGHTDNRPLVVLLPSIAALRDELQARYGYARVPRVGAAGGIGTPAAVAAAFAMGAAYVVTGSINQACVEAGTSPHTRALLAQAEYADVAMAPAADMFEMGVDVQVLKRGTFFPMRARRLYELYRSHASLEEIPASERDRLERQLFGRSLDAVWDETVAYFTERDPEQIARAEADPKHRMALLFRWYLGLASRWANTGEPGRELDYQIWCGPAMGAFNDWARGGPFEAPENRLAAEVGRALMDGAAYLLRLSQLEAQGVRPAPGLRAARHAAAS
jgi:trans-AT polyketide synthase, acyltransferase and oxidoreductase domains